MKKYLITTFGCQLNENDSEKLAGITEKLGYEKNWKFTRSRSSNI